MVVPLRLFERQVPRLIKPIDAFELDCLNAINKSGNFRITRENIDCFSKTGWFSRDILEFSEPSEIDFLGKSNITLFLTKHAKKILEQTEIGYVWNTVKKNIDLKATRNFYLQYTRPHQYHFYGNDTSSVIILPMKIAKKLYEMNDRRFDDIKESMQMILLKADKVKDDWILKEEDY